MDKYKNHFEKLRTTEPVRYLFAIATAELLIKTYQQTHPDKNLDINGIATIGNKEVNQEEIHRLKTLIEIVVADLKEHKQNESFPSSHLALEMIGEMQQKHDALSNHETGNDIYIAIYEQILPYLVELRENAPRMKTLNEIHAIFNTCFFYKTTQQIKEKERQFMKDPLEKMENLLNVLGEFMTKNTK